MPSDIGIASYFGWSALICGYHRLGYSIFTDPNEKFINVDVKAFVKADAKEPHFGKSSYTDWKRFMQQSAWFKCRFNDSNRFSL